MDIQSISRLMNLFGQPQAQPGIDTSNMGMPQLFPPIQPQLNELPDDTQSDLLNQYQPRMAATNALTSSLQSMPQRPVPGRMRELGAAIAGMGAGASPVGISGGQPIGYKFDPLKADVASDKIKYGDYDNQLADWKTQVSALTGAANEEDRANAGEVRRLAGDAQRDINQQKADILQQQADTASEKNRNIHEVKMKQLTDAVEKADKELMLKKQALDLKRDDLNATQEYHKAQLASIDARRKAQTADDEYKLEEMKRLHDAQIERMKVLNQRPYPGADNETTTQYVDSAGNPTTVDKAVGTRKITRRDTGGEVQMLNKDNVPVMIPANMVDDYIKNYGGRRLPQ